MTHADRTALFWLEQAQALDWITPPTRAGEASFHTPVHIRWFDNGVLNLCYNCVDRHLPSRANHTAILWEPDSPGSAHHLSYGELHEAVCRTANILRELGVAKGDRVAIYMPMIPQAAIAMLACARIGAVHSVVFGGFSASSLAGRIQDCGAKIVITADEARRGGKTVPLKANVDEALRSCPSVAHVLVVRHTGAHIDWQESRDQDYHVLLPTVSATCPCEPMAAEDPLFILYTSGSTGRPKGILHTTGGYATYALYSFRHVFGVREDDIYWCSADVGWITGHTYVTYAPLLAGITTLMFEGVPHHPDYSRFWRVVDAHGVTIFYTAPTAIRALMKQGDEWLENTSRESLRVLGSVGEPINPEAWHWYHQVVGKGRCAVVDTWWQTETGGILISATAADDSRKAGYATKPLPHIEAALLDANGVAITGEGEGNLCIAASWPGQARSIYGDHARFEQTYFSTYPGYYMTGDGAERDAQGDYRITGRVDDVLNVSGHRLGTAEIEAALNKHPAVAESAVVGFTHEIKGQGVFAFVILKLGATPPNALEAELNALLRRDVGTVAKLDRLAVVPDLPKTRSGKIMRRILRKLAEGSTEFGDTSTLADPVVVETLMQSVLKKTLAPAPVDATQGA